MSKKYWTSEELEYLEKNYNKKSKKAIAKYLNRSVHSVIHKAKRENISMSKEYTDDLTVAEFCRVFKADQHIVVRIWIKKYGLKAKKRGNIWQIAIKDIWEFARSHPTTLKLYEMEQGILGEEPNDIKELRRTQIKGIKKYRKWSKIDLSYIQTFYNKKPTKEIAKYLNRTEEAIIHKARELGVRKYDNYCRLPWRSEEVEILMNLTVRGYSSLRIAYELGRNKNMINAKRQKLVLANILKYENGRWYKVEG